jgi:hypothetical protein
LVFDPLSEQAAHSLLKELRLRLRVLSLRQSTIFAVPESDLTISPINHSGRYNGPFPTLIPEESELHPMWMDAWSSSSTDGVALLSQTLSNCPAIEDERIIAAIDLAVTSRYDSLPRSIFLSQLTIIDSLARQTNRSKQLRDWIDEKCEEAKVFEDAGLLSALGNLKRVSHGSAVRELVGRAAHAMGEDKTQVEARQNLAQNLYKTRSALSHAGSILPENSVGQARELAALVIDAAIKHPAILDVIEATSSNPE